eukprot:1056915-Lingulodinium_polyedra.AAC.1
MGSSGAGRAAWHTRTARTTCAARPTSSGCSGWQTMLPVPTMSGRGATCTTARWRRPTGLLRSTSTA